MDCVPSVRMSGAVPVWQARGLRFGGSTVKLDNLAYSCKAKDLDNYEERPDVKVTDITHHLTQARRSLFLHGPEGCGKSMLASKALQQLKASGIPVYPFKGVPEQCLLGDQQLKALGTILEALKDRDEKKLRRGIRDSFYFSVEASRLISDVAKSNDSSRLKPMLRPGIRITSKLWKNLALYDKSQDFKKLAAILKPEYCYEPDLDAKVEDAFQYYKAAMYRSKAKNGPPVIVAVEEFIKGIIAKEANKNYKAPPPESGMKAEPINQNMRKLMMTSLAELQQRFPNLRLLVTEESSFADMLDIYDDPDPKKERENLLKVFPPTTGRRQLEMLDNVLNFFKALLPRAGFFISEENGARITQARKPENTRKVDSTHVRAIWYPISSKLKALAEGPKPQRTEDESQMEEIPAKLLALSFPDAFPEFAVKKKKTKKTS